MLFQTIWNPVPEDAELARQLPPVQVGGPQVVLKVVPGCGHELALETAVVGDGGSVYGRYYFMAERRMASCGGEHDD